VNTHIVIALTKYKARFCGFFVCESKHNFVNPYGSRFFQKCDSETVMQAFRFQQR